MIYAVNAVGIEALNTMASLIDNASSEISTTTANLVAVSDELGDTLGPHKASLDNALNEILQAVKDSTEPASETANALRGVAMAYEEIINDDGFQRVRTR